MSEEIKVDDFNYILENDLKVVGLICENKETISFILKPDSPLYQSLPSRVFAISGDSTPESNSKESS